MAAVFFAVLVALATATPHPIPHGDVQDSLMSTLMSVKLATRDRCWKSGDCPKIQANLKAQTGAPVNCVNGYAGEYPCNNVNMLSYLDFASLGCTYIANPEGNDVWGWQYPNPNTGVMSYFAIVGCTTGTAFVDITDPINPQTIGFMPTNGTISSVWRDMKVYRTTAYVVSEARNHGMQVFDLMRLFNQATPGPLNIMTANMVFVEGMGNSTQRSTHNIAINEESGRAYLVGCKTCAGGLLIVDISDELKPKQIGCYAGDGYTHDTQCILYNNINFPDSEYMNREICFAFNEDTVTILDVTNPTNIVMLAREPYPGVRYCHQGWITEDAYYMMHDDELDEYYNTTIYGDKKTVTYIWSIEDLNRPQLVSHFKSTQTSIDHNQYIEGQCTYQSNYDSGLRVLMWNQELATPGYIPTEVAYFDCDPDPAHAADFYGAWSTYPYFDGSSYGNDQMDNVVLLNSIERGLFVLEVQKKDLACVS